MRDGPGSARYSSEANEAAQQAGYTVVDEDGICDYQGWGILLLSPPAVLDWSYGSCGGCDPYEDNPGVDPVEDLKSRIETFASAELAKARYDEVVSRGW